MGQAAKELRASWRRRYRSLLDAIFDECAPGNEWITPDMAMDLMEEWLKDRISPENDPKSGKENSATVGPLRFDAAAFRREAHHYAVDQFYKTYFPRRPGAPPLADSYLDRILKLRRKGLSHLAIADKLGIRRDTAKYQVAAAEKRWCEAVERIEQLKRKYPHLVAPDSRTAGQKPGASGSQSKDQKRRKGRRK